MTPAQQLTPAQQGVLDRLGQPLAQRPTFPPDIHTKLALDLERGMAPLVEHLGPKRLVLAKRTLDMVHGCEARFLADEAATFEWTAAIARGTVAHKAIELTMGLGHDAPALDLVDEAIASIQRADSGLADWLHRIDAGERAELVVAANAVVSAFQETFPPLDRAWKPVVEGPVRHELFDGRIALSGRPDLTLGQARDGVAGKVVIDFKTGSSGTAHLADLRFYSLLETLRVGTPPRIVATHYLSQGRLHAEEVTEASLDAAVARVVDAAHKIVALHRPDAEPTRTTSPGCRWCPALPDCDAGKRFLGDLDDDPVFDDE